MTRRDALVAISGGAAALWSIAAGALSAVFLGSTLRMRSRPDEIIAGDASIADTEFRSVRLRIPLQDGWEERQENRIVYVRADPTQPDHPIVLSATCSHLGCSVKWDESKREFACPCHGGRFGSDGKVIEGPPPRPLTRLDAEIRDGDIYLRLEA